ncbi:MAG: PspA/IM30 family protein [Anaerolineae bacterium]|nr:PspA/IM30 family protein [Anaerolineae bacterium]MDW8300399.1 PspA/IM30 family protein [Anaerolineae bacterium]
MNLLQKIGILVSATLHSIVDRALQANSVAVFDEYIRQAENSMRLIQSALVDLKATVKTLHTKYNQAADEAARLDLQIDQALQAGKESLAKAHMVRLNSLVEIAQTYKAQYERQNRAYNTLTETVQILQSKVDVLRAQRDQVATMLELIRSKNIVARSIKDIDKIADARTRQIMENVRSQLDMADARLEMATSRLSAELEEQAGDLTIEAQLEERRQRLGLA